MVEPTPERVQTLAEASCPCGHAAITWHRTTCRMGAGCLCRRTLTEAILVSDWLRDRIAAERADAARQALAPVLALADEWDHREYVRMPEDFAASLRAAAGGGEGQ